MKKVVLASMLILSGALLSACGGGSSSSTGTARIYLTDAPSCGYDHVYITVDHIDLSSDSSSWTSVPVEASVGRIDLLDLQNGIMQQLAKDPQMLVVSDRVVVRCKTLDELLGHEITSCRRAGSRRQVH